MFTEHELAVARRAYAKQMLALGRIVDNPALEAALAQVPREAFLGPPPWKMIGYDPKDETPLNFNDPVILYQDMVFSLDSKRGVNNGSPSLHARWLDALKPEPGDHVAHIGAGGGYYTAILAHLVGGTGQVTAVEFNAGLAKRAKQNLADLTNVTVVCGDGTQFPTAQCDRIYVNFGVEKPADAWIEQIKPAGTLVFPLGVPRPPTPRASFGSIAGGGFLITREQQGFAARHLGPAYFIGAEGGFAASEPDREALRAAFKTGGAEWVRSLIWKSPIPAETWFTGTDWALAYDEVSA